MDLLKEVEAIDADPDRRLSLIERAKTQDDEAVKLLFYHALYVQLKRNKTIAVRRKPVLFHELRWILRKNATFDITYA